MALLSADGAREALPPGRRAGERWVTPAGRRGDAPGAYSEGGEALPLRATAGGQWKGLPAGDLVLEAAGVEVGDGAGVIPYRHADWG